LRDDAFVAFRAFTVGRFRVAVFDALRTTTFAARRVFLTTRLAVRLTALRAGAGMTRSAAPDADCDTDDAVEAAVSATCDAVFTAPPRALPTISADRTRMPSAGGTRSSAISPPRIVFETRDDKRETGDLVMS
jgi:hypothetical protein